MPSVSQKPYAQDAVVACMSTLDPQEHTTEKSTVLVQHCAFWDRDGDGIIWPLDTFRGFRELGYNIILSIIAIFVIHTGFSYPTRLQHSLVPDPFFRVYLDGIHKAKHGSDTGTYNNQGYFQPQVFEGIFNRYSASGDALTVREAFNIIKGQRVAMDPFGWFAAFFEFYTLVLSTYDAKSGVCPKDSIVRLYDGSFFWHVKQCRETGRSEEVAGMGFWDGIECLRRRGEPVQAKVTK